MTVLVDRDVPCGACARTDRPLYIVFTRRAVLLLCGRCRDERNAAVRRVVRRVEFQWLRDRFFRGEVA